jgi:hypothetical protein
MKDFDKLQKRRERERPSESRRERRRERREEKGERERDEKKFRHNPERRMKSTALKDVHGILQDLFKSFPASCNPKLQHL